MENVFRFTLLSALLMSANANASFNNGYELSTWTQIANGGSIDISGAPDTVILTSSNDGSGDEKNQDFILTAPENADISFAWSFQTTDSNEYDPFGLLLNGVFTQLSKNVGSSNQTDIFSFSVATGDIFGFRANSIDSQSGASITEISNFTAVPRAVPIPSAFLLMGSSLMCWLVKKRKPIV